MKIGQQEIGVYPLWIGLWLLIIIVSLIWRPLDPW